VWAFDRINGLPSTDTTVYVLNIKDADVQRLEVTTAAGTTTFERAEPLGWRFTDRDEQADLGRVNGVVTRLSKMRSSAKVAENVTDLARYGLAPPVDTAMLTMKDGTTVRILIGNKTVNDSAYYVTVEGKNELHTVNTLLVGDVEKLITDPPVASGTATPAPGAAPVGTPVAPAGANAELSPTLPGPEGTPTATVGLPAVRVDQ
jgi:hypothetical protein